MDRAACGIALLARGRRLALLLTGVTMLAMSAACGGDDGADDGAAQPAPDGTAFTSDGALQDIPRYPRSTQLGERHDEDAATSVSFVVRDASPEDIMEFYARRLADHPVVEEPRSVGKDALRGDWMIDGRRLRVSVIPAPTAEEQEQPATFVETQYSLTLYEEGVEPPN